VCVHFSSGTVANQHANLRELATVRWMLSHECRELLGMRPCWAYSKVLPKNYFDFFTNLMRQYF